MVHPVLLGLQVADVLLAGGHLGGDHLHHLDACLGEPVLLVRVVAQEPDLVESHLGEDLGRGLVAARVDRQPELLVGLHGVEPGLLQGVGLHLVRQADPAAFLAAQVQQGAAEFVDQLEGVGQLFAAVAAVGAEHIAGEALRMQAHQRGLAVSRAPSAN